MRRAILFVLVLAACSTKEERARQAAEFRQSRDSLLSAEVVKSLQPQSPNGHLIYARPADLSYDSLLIKRPDLARVADRRTP